VRDRLRTLLLELSAGLCHPARLVRRRIRRPRLEPCIGDRHDDDQVPPARPGSAAGEYLVLAISPAKTNHHASRGSTTRDRRDSTATASTGRPHPRNVSNGRLVSLPYGFHAAVIGGRAISAVRSRTFLRSGRDGDGKRRR